MSGTSHLFGRYHPPRGPDWLRLTVHECRNPGRTVAGGSYNRYRPTPTTKTNEARDESRASSRLHVRS